MKLVFIRHAEPDYSIDSLTPVGWEEAALLADHLANILDNTEHTSFYVSPLGRAKDTASLTLEKMNRTAEVCDWLREFTPRIRRPDLAEDAKSSVAWDWLPADWTADEHFYDKDAWHTNEIMQAADTGKIYQKVVNRFDHLLTKHGYKREGNYYRAVRPNHDTLVFFCHFGLECVLLSHLMNCSPMILWHGTCAAPSSVTTLVTEERREGIAYFRMGSFGSTTHLYAGGKEPSFAARFCETYDSKEERHD